MDLLSARSLAALLACFCAFLTCGVTEASTLFADSFDDETTGLPPSGWTEHYYGPNQTPVYTREEAAALGVTIQVDEAVYYGASGKSVQFLDTTSSVFGVLETTYTPASFVMIEYYMRTHDDTSEGVFVQLTGDGDRYDNTACFGNEAGGGQAGYIGIFNGLDGWIKPDLLAYAEDTWYGVRRVLDCTTNTGWFQVWEADNPTNSASWSVGSPGASPNTYVNGIWMTTSGGQHADCYIDEITITQVPEPGTLGLAALGALGLLLRRRGR